jgi:hypothetical protein
MTLPKAIQLEFGRSPLSAFQKAGRVASAIVRITRAERAAVEKAARAAVKAVKAPVKLGKAIAKRTTSKKKAAEIEAAGENNNNSNKIEESEIVYIREADITPKVKRNTRLAKKNLRLRFLSFVEK